MRSTLQKLRLMSITRRSDHEILHDWSSYFGLRQSETFEDRLPFAEIYSNKILKCRNKYKILWHHSKHAPYIVGKHKKPVSDPESAFDKNRIWCSAQNTWCSARSKWAFISSIWEYASPFGVLYMHDVSGSSSCEAKSQARNARDNLLISCVCFWIRITWAWNNSLGCFE
jgi:hypothetical protein